MKRSQIYSLLLLLLFCCLFIEVQPWRTKLTGKRKEASEDVLPIKITNDKDIIWQRGDTPPSFYLPTLTGTFTFTPLASGEQNPIVFYAFNQQSTFQVAMWDHDTYLSTLFKKSENTTQYVFLNYNETNTIQVASYMASRCEYILGSLGFTPASITQWNSRLHFVTVPVSQLTSGDNFIPSLLSQWVSSLTYLNVTYPSTSVCFPFLRTRIFLTNKFFKGAKSSQTRWALALDHFHDKCVQQYHFQHSCLVWRRLC